MFLSLRPRDRNILLRIVLGSIACALFITWANDGHSNRSLLMALIIGCLTGPIITLVELGALRKRLRRMAFTPAFIVRFAIYEAVIWGIIFGANVAIRHTHDLGLSVGDVVTSVSNSAKFALAISILVEVRQLLGPKFLVNLLTGRYHHPKLEDRILMFLDIKSSTTIAETLGPVRFHQLIRDFFFDVTDPIVESRGEIYKYVGDEVIVSWRVGKPAQNAAIMDGFFEMIRCIERKRDVYRSRYGVVPEFKAGLHVGPLVIGEMGVVRKEIALLGDTVNTAARIQGECNRFDQRLIVSKDFLDVCTLSDAYRTETLGRLLLKGKQVEIELFGVEEARSPSPVPVLK